MRFIGATRVVAILLAAIVTLSGCDSAEERVADHHARGMELLEAGEVEKAALEFRNAIRIDETFVPSWVALSRVSEQRGDVAAMVSQLRKVIELDPAHLEARSRLGRVMLAAGQHQEALTHAETALRIAPDHREARLVRGGALLALGETALALADARELLGRDPADAEATLLLVTERLLAGNRGGALVLVDRFLAEHPADPVMNRAKVQILVAEGDIGALAEQLERMSAQAPEDRAIHAALAEVYARAGRNGEAEARLRRIRALSPDDPGSLRTLARFILQARGVPAARAEIVGEIERAEAGEGQGDAFELKLMLADFDLQTGQPDAARSLLEDLIAAGPEAERTDRARLALAQSLLAGGENDRALALADEVIGRDAANVTALAIRAAVLAEREEPEEAVIHLRKALNEEPENVALLRLAARVYKRNGNWSLAGESLAKAVELSGYEPEIVVAYASLLGESDQREAAEALLAAAAERRPGNLQILSLLASLRVQAGDWRGAEELVPSIAALDPGAGARMRALIEMSAGAAEDRLAVLQTLAADGQAGTGVVTALVAAHVQLGQVAAAEALVDGMLEKDPADAEALRLKGGLALVRGDAGAGERFLRAAVAADPAHGAAQLSLARFLVAEDRGDEAVAALDTGLEAAPESVLLWLYRGELMLASGDPEAALAAYGRLYELQPDSLVAANNLASLLSEYWPDDPERLDRAHAIGKRLSGAANPAFQDTWGWILYLRGEHGGALRSLVPAAEALPGNPWVRYHAGMAYAALDRAEEARGHLEAALELAGEGSFAPRPEIEAALDTLPTIQ